MTILSEIKGAKLRFLGSLVFIPIIFAFWYDVVLGGVVLVGLALLMLRELKHIIKLPTAMGNLIFCLTIVQVIPYWLFDRAPIFVLGLALTVTILVRIHTNLLVSFFVGLLSLCLGFACLFLSQPYGHLILLTLAVIIAACDSAAYFVGRLIGGTKLWPRVSPKKTISGGFGGLVAATLVTILFADTLSINNKLEAFTIGLLLGVFAQAGDLMESAVKREFKVKDSGSILPGHGGMLDRLDGYFLVIPLMYLYIFSL